MASKAAHKRLTKEYMAMQKEPPPYIFAKPSEVNILEWHYVIRGPPDTPYADGEYHGTLTFAPDYPFKPPAIRMITPSGRFQTNTRLCLSMSDFHPGTWNPSWSVATILNGLLSFMVSDETTTGSIRTSDTDKRIYASRSHEFNLSNKKFRELYPELCTLRITDLPNMGVKVPLYKSSSEPFEALIDKHASNEYTAQETQNHIRPLMPIKPVRPINNRQTRIEPKLAKPAPNMNVGTRAVGPTGTGANVGAASTGAGAPNLNGRPPSPMAGLYKWAIFVAVCGYLVIAKFVSRGDSIGYSH